MGRPVLFVFCGLGFFLLVVFACVPDYRYAGEPVTGDERGDERTGDVPIVPPVDEAGLRRGALSAGGEHTCVVRSGQAFCWGDDSAGQLAHPRPTRAPAAALLGDGKPLTGVTEVGTGENFTCAIADGKAYCWGGNSVGQTGTEDFENHPSATRVKPEAATGDLVHIAVGSFTSCAIKTSGDVICWGLNRAGIIPGEPLDYIRGAKRIDALKGAKKLALGLEFGCAIRADDTVACWGANEHRQSGSATSESCFFSFDSVTTPCVRTPTAVPGLSPVIDLVVAFHHACAIERGGAVKCWGFHQWGDLGPTVDAATCTINDAGEPCSERAWPVVGAGAVLLSSGGNSEGAVSCYSGGDAGVFCWGFNGYAGLGQGQNDNDPHPDPLPVRSETLEDLPNAVDLSTGRTHSCVLMPSGKVLCWGVDLNDAGIFATLPSARRATEIPF
jgi:serine/threonine-protein kinase